ncbi:MAG: bifunctional diaminohydroxyphosphoribosylaminopyrimidine deaminase/5-amino-6-(5-phosphoribosylamino)uracil reductase RibD [Robiginitalea sp.]
MKKATLYVTLEPCCHHGKTPPCTDLILEMGIPRVVIGTPDPHEKVGGQGISRLREAGCEVLVGILQDRCREHHRRFITFHEKRRPYIIRKWAQSADGFMAPPRNLRAKTPRPFWISGKAARQLVHQWRSEEQGILVGTRTALEDNPRLNTRLWSGSSPLRILIDRELKVPRNYHIYNTEANTLIFCNVAYQPETTANLRFHGLTGQKPLLLEVLEGLWKEQVQSVLVEGGARTLNGFLEKGIWDEARILEGPNTMGNGLEAPQVEGTLVDHWKLEKDQISIVRNDT